MNLRHDVVMALATAAALTVPVVVARAATAGGVVAGFLHAGWFAWEGGVETVLAFVALVGLGVAATRLGRARKEALGTAQAGGGRRSARHVLANAGPAALCLLAGAIWPSIEAVARAGACAALAGSLADTVGGELGMLAREQPRMLLFGKAVTRGADGGMTFAGVGASAAAAVLVAAATWLAGGVPFWATVAGGLAGSIGDSILGATVERAGGLGNEGVNFWSSLAAGATGAAWAGTLA
jgi:uncharacterized protein (TIGR00297 family)